MRGFKRPGLILAGIGVTVLLLSGGLTACMAPAPAGTAVSVPVSVSVSPEEDYNPVMTQHTITAQVMADGGGVAADTEVVWILNRFPDAVGDVVSADIEDMDADRDNHYVTTTTNSEGQASIVITSTRPGDTDVTTYVPGIVDASVHKVFSTKHWLNLQVKWPVDATNLAGSSHVFTTKLMTVMSEAQLPGYPPGWLTVKRGVGDPLPGYKVRWTIIDDSPSAYFSEGSRQTKVWTSTTDNLGEASVTLEQTGPASGDNTILIEVLAPNDITMFNEQATKTWVSPTLRLTKDGPETALIGNTVTYDIEVTNTGDIASNGVVVKDTLPKGMTYVSSTPSGSVSGGVVTWNVGTLATNASKAIALKLKAAQEGSWTDVARVTSAEGLEAEARATTKVIAPSVQITKTGTDAIHLGENADYTITVKNTSNIALTGVKVRDDIPAGMSYVSSTVDADQAGRVVTWNLGSVAAGATETIGLTLKSTDRGTWTNSVLVTSAEGASASAEKKTLVIAEAGVTISTTDSIDPVVVGQQTTYIITVKNQGNIDVHNLVIKDSLPAQTRFVAADGPVAHTAAAGVVTFEPVTVLATGQTLTYEVTARATVEGSALNNVTLTYDEFGAAVVVQEGTTIFKIN